MLTPAADDNRPKRRIVLPVLAVVILALLGTVAYQLIRADSYRAAVRPTTAFTKIRTWRCVACGHTLREQGAVGPHRCPACGQDTLYVRINHSCPTHGVFPVAFQYDEDANPIQVKVADGPWGPYLTEEGGLNISCPVCQGGLIPLE